MVVNNVCLCVFLLDWFYATRAVIIISLLAACFYLFTNPSIWACLLSACCLGLAWQQLAFVGHDIGHHVLSHNQSVDDVLGVVFGNALQGMRLITSLDLFP